MKRQATRPRTLVVLIGILAVVAAVWLSAASARTRKPVVVPPDAVLTWNTNTVNAVRASLPTKFQTDGMVYMSYVQAAVYDAVTKLMGGYQPYHDFAFTPAPGASVQAAVAAASQATLDWYLKDQQTTVDGEYASYIASLGGLGAPGVADGVALGQAAAADIIALRTGDGLNNTAVPSYGSNGAILPGQWQLQGAEPEGADAVVRDDASVPAGGAEPVPRSAAALAHEPHLRARSQRDRGLRRAQQHGPHSRADRDRVLLGRLQRQPVQRDDAERRQPAPDGHRRRRASLRDRQHRHQRRRHRLLRLEVLLPVLAPDHGDPERRQGQQPRHDCRPDAGSRCCGVPGHPEYPSQHGCFTSAFADTLAEALHTQHIDVVMPGGNDGTSALHTTQHFDTVRDIDRQVVDARVWLGFHFRNSVEQGEKVGNHVADWELDHYFKPVHS